MVMGSNSYVIMKALKQELEMFVSQPEAFLGITVNFGRSFVSMKRRRLVTLALCAERRSGSPGRVRTYKASLPPWIEDYG